MIELNTKNNVINVLNYVRQDVWEDDYVNSSYDVRDYVSDHVWRNVYRNVSNTFTNNVHENIERYLKNHTKQI